MVLWLRKRFFLKVNYRKDDSKKLFNNLSIEIKLFYGTTNAVFAEKERFAHFEKNVVLWCYGCE